MLKRGVREGPNVTNPTLTHDRPTKLFALLGHYIAVADARVLFPQWCDCSQLLTYSELLVKFHIRQLRPDVEHLCGKSAKRGFRIEEKVVVIRTSSVRRTPAANQILRGGDPLRELKLETSFEKT